MDYLAGNVQLVIAIFEQIIDALMDNSDIDDTQFNSFKMAFSELIRDEVAYHRRSSYCWDESLFDIDLKNLIMDLKNNIENQFIYLATINSVYLIPLLANSEFNELLKTNPHQDVSIHFNPEKPDEWIIVPIINNSESPSLSIRFTLPELLRQYIHQDAVKAMMVKEKMIDKIVFIAYLDSENPTLCTLTFNKAATLRNPWTFR